MDLQDKFNWFGNLTPHVRRQMNALLDRICTAYAETHRIALEPLGPGMGGAQLHYTGNRHRHMAGHVGVLPWQAFVDTGLYAISIKHWLLSSSYECWYDGIVGDSRNAGIVTTCYRCWSQELYQGIHRMLFDIVGATDYFNGHIVARPGRGHELDDGSMYFFLKNNRCAAFEHAVQLGVGQSLRIGVETGPDPVPRPADRGAGLYRYSLDTLVLDRLSAMTW